MRFTFEYAPEWRALYIKFDSTAGIEDIQAAWKCIVNSDTIPPDADAVWDISDIDLSIADRDALEQLLRFRREISSKRGNPRVATVVKKGVGDWIIALYNALHPSHNLEIPRDFQVFYDRESAWEWMKKQTEEPEISNADAPPPRRSLDGDHDQ